MSDAMREAFETYMPDGCEFDVLGTKPSHWRTWQAATEQSQKCIADLEASHEAEKNAWEDLNNKVCARNEELHRELAAAERKLAEQQATINYALRFIPTGSDAEVILNETGTKELTKLISEAEQHGRDALMKKLSEQEPVGVVESSVFKDIRWFPSAADHLCVGAKLIIRPSTPIVATKENKA